MHWGGADSTNRVAGVAMDEAAEVALLTRAIVIQGQKYPSNPLIGQSVHPADHRQSARWHARWTCSVLSRKCRWLRCTSVNE